MTTHAPMTLEDANQFISSIPFVKVAGMRATSLGADHATSVIRLIPPLSAPGHPDRFSNALIAAAIDQAGSLTLWGKVGSRMPMATVSLAITFTDAAIGDQVEFQARCISVGHNLGHTLVTAVRPDGAVVAHGMVNYIIGAFPGGVESNVATRPKLTDEVGGEKILPLSGADMSAAVGVQHLAPGVVRVPYAPHLVGSREQIAFHGGILALTAMEAAQSAVAAHPELRLSHLVVDYLRAAQAKDLSATTTLIHQSRKTATLGVKVTQDDGARECVTATARFVSGG
jgi:acyl-coenzyme A thioesterase PaaI-like protein